MTNSWPIKVEKPIFDLESSGLEYRRHAFHLGLSRKISERRVHKAQTELDHAELPHEAFKARLKLDTWLGNHLVRQGMMPLTRVVDGVLGTTFDPGYGVDRHYSDRERGKPSLINWLAVLPMQGEYFDYNNDNPCTAVLGTLAVLLVPPLWLAAGAGAAPKAVGSGLGAMLGAFAGLPHGAAKAQQLVRAGRAMEGWLNAAAHGDDAQASALCKRAAKHLDMDPSHLETALPLLSQEPATHTRMAIVRSAQRTPASLQPWVETLKNIDFLGVDGSVQRSVIRWFGALDDADVQEIAHLLPDIHGITDGGQRMQVLLDVMADAPGARRAHLNRLLQPHRANAHASNIIDDHENVMDPATRARMDKAIVWLQKKFSKTSAPATVLSNIKKFAEKAVAEAKPDAWIRNTRPESNHGTATELDNIYGAMERIGENPNYYVRQRYPLGVATLLARVDAAIKAYRSDDKKQPTAKSQENMRHNILSALAQCREDDGHFVCTVGIARRLMTVLQGYYPEVDIDRNQVLPSQLLNQLGADFAPALENTPAVKLAVDAFKLQALHTARTYYAKDPEALKEFEQKLDQFCAMTVRAYA